MTATIISDTHGEHENLIIPETDILISCGDVAYSQDKLKLFLRWFASLDAKYKIFVAGNHEGFVEKIGKEKMIALCAEFDSRIIYLEDESTVIEGIKFYGTPWTPTFKDWHFMKDEEDLKEVWDLIPDDTEVLINHGPQYGVLDRIQNRSGDYIHLGSPTLSNRISQLKNLKYHLFGHIHPDTGLVEINEDRPYVSINAAASRKNGYETRTKGVKGPIVLEL